MESGPKRAGVTLTLYSRAGCHLCEQAEAALSELGAYFERIDVATCPDLEARYGWDVPVLLRGETVLGKGVLTKSRLVKLLRES